MVVNPSVMSPAMKDIAATVHKAADDARDVAAETTHDLRERLAELRDEVAQQAAKQQLHGKHARAKKSRTLSHGKKLSGKNSHRGRSLLLCLFAAIGIAAVVMYVKRRQEALDYGPSSDAFGAAVVEQQRAASDGEPVVTPGA